MKTIEIDVFKDYKVSLGWFEGDKVISKNVKVNISGNAKIKSAELEVECNTSGMGIDVWFNYNKVLHLDTNKDLADKVEVNVVPNADNNITIKVYRMSPFPTPVTAIINVKLIITYETIVVHPVQPTQPTTPQPSQPTQSRQTSKSSNINNIIIDVLTGVLIGGITYMLFRRKRR